MPSFYSSGGRGGYGGCTKCETSTCNITCEVCVTFQYGKAGSVQAMKG